MEAHKQRDVSGEWSHEVDVLIVGSGAAGLTAAWRCAKAGAKTLVIEKQSTFGGATWYSGGVLWIPANPLMSVAGMPDTEDEGRRYLDDLIGDVGPASSGARRDAFLSSGPKLVQELVDAGVELEWCRGYSDYHDRRVGGRPLGRAVEPAIFDASGLDEQILARLPERAGPERLIIQAVDVPYLSLMGRTTAGARRAAKVLGRTAAGRARGRRDLAAGAALIARLLSLVADGGVALEADSGLNRLIVDDGRVTGAEVGGNGVGRRIKARQAVFLCAGGFAKSATLRDASGPRPHSTDWSLSPPGDTGDGIDVGVRDTGAAVALMDDAFWVPVALDPEVGPQGLVAERSKPHCLIVDSGGARFVDEAVDYMSMGQEMYRRHQKSPAVPSWLIMDSRHRRRYGWGAQAPGRMPAAWIRSGYFVEARSLEELASRCEIDAAALTSTIERFNRWAGIGKDEDFGKGDSAYDRYYGDPRQKPNPCLGAIEKAPFYATAIYPGDVGTNGGLLTDEFARVLGEDGSVIPGLYAAGNGTASVMGHVYPGPGGTIAPAMVFGYRGAEHLTAVGKAAS